MTLPQPAGTRLLPRSLCCLRQRRREQAGGCQLLRLPPVLRGLTAPRLAFSGDPALSRPRIPKVEHYSTRTPVRQPSTRPHRDLPVLKSAGREPARPAWRSARVPPVRRCFTMIGRGGERRRAPGRAGAVRGALPMLGVRDCPIGLDDRRRGGASSRSGARMPRERAARRPIILDECRPASVNGPGTAAERSRNVSRDLGTRRRARAGGPVAHRGRRCPAADRAAACPARCPARPWRVRGRRCTARAARS